MMGDDWGAAIIPLRLLCVVGMVRAITMLNGSALQAWGRPGLHAKMTWTSALPSCSSFLLVGQLLVDSSTEIQVIGIAASRAVLYGLILLPLAQFWFVGRLFGARARTTLGLLGPTVLIAIGTAAGGAALSEFLDRQQVPALLRFIAVTGTTFMACVGLLLILNPEAGRTFQTLLARVRGRRSA
jgi:O-antigen/teichoic acid export membrane protein